MYENRWITLEEHGDALTIDVTQLLGEILDDLNRKSTPKLLLFIGDASTSKLQECFDLQESSWLDDRGVNLQLYPQAVAPGRELRRQALLAHGPVFARRIGLNDHNRGKAIPWLKGYQKPYSLAANYSRLLGPLFDVICIMLSSFPSIDSLVEFLSVWALAYSSTSSDPSIAIRPVLVVIADGEVGLGVAGDTAGMIKDQIENGILSQTRFSTNRVFFDFHVQVWKKQTHTKLRGSLLDLCLTARRVKTHQKTTFDPRNLVYLFNASYQCLMNDTVFDPISASRRHNMLPVEADKRIATFLSDFVGNLSKLKNKTLELLMSAMLQHAFPTGSHLLYKGAWRKAVQAAHLCVNSQSYLENQLLLTAAGLPVNTTRLVRRHLRLCSKIYRVTKYPIGTKYCPLCIIRPPQVPLPCGHRYCIEDIRLMGREVQRNTFLVGESVVCRQPMTPVQYHFRPNARGIRVLAFDGGGIRGGICILTLAHKGLPIAKAIRSFLRLSESTFAKQPIWRRALNILIHGSLNSAINRPLKHHYGESTLSDFSPAIVRGMKLFITAKGTPCGDYIISNFHPTDSNKAHNDYQHALPAEASRGIKVWEAVRATSAAPVMFTPHNIAGLGTFQDGGLWQNNPLALALSEAREMWPSANRPDVALSIGTGFYKSTKSSTPAAEACLEETHSQSSRDNMNDLVNTSDHIIVYLLWKVCFIASFLRFLLSLMDSPDMDSDKCQRYISRHGLAEHQARERTFRLDIAFPMECPRLDDLASMRDIRREAVNQFSHNPDIQRVADLLISGLFFLELTERPCRHNTYVSFRGHILCDVNPGAELQRLLLVLLEHGSMFEVCGRTFPLSEVDAQEATKMEFDLFVSGTVTEFVTPSPISLIQGRPSEKVSHPISRSPMSLEELLRVQGWDCPLIERPAESRKRHWVNTKPDLQVRPSKRACTS